MTQEISEYMNGVRWKTALYFGAWAASMLLAMAGIYYGLKADIKDSNYSSTWHYFKLEKKIDSLHQIDQTDIKTLTDKVDAKPQPVSFRGRFESYTQRWVEIDGKRTLIYIPIK